MPTYDYVCEACGHEFEHFQSMTDRHLRACPSCGKKKLIRKVGAGAGLIFKGSGFYVTDYKKAAAPGDSKSDAKPESKTDAKPAEKASESAAKSEPPAPSSRSKTSETKSAARPPGGAKTKDDP